MPLASLEFSCIEDFGSPLLWEFIQHAYSEPHRAYHTLDHLAAMFGHCADVADQLHHPRSVRWAIWFHDYVYRTEAQHYPDNEAMSATAMVELLQAKCPPLARQTEHGLPCLELAAAMILATKHHRPAMGNFAQHSHAVTDCCTLLDLDLAILAQTREDVAAFDDGVRQEFAQYSDEAFAAGRIQALQHFLARDKIYLSPAFAPLEPVARENLAWLITRWQQQPG